MNNIRIYAFADEAASDLESQIYAMLRNRLNGLEIRGINGRNISEVSLDTAREIRRRLDENGLKTWSIGSPIGKISIDEPFGAHLDLFRHTLEVAHVLGTENLRMFSFYMPANRDPEQFTDAVIERVGRLVDAARDLGASRLKAFTSVTLPLTMPGLLSGIILTFIPSMGLFFIADILGGNKIVLVGSMIQELMTRGRNLPLAAAMAVVLMLMTSALLWLYRKISRTSKLEGLV